MKFYEQTDHIIETQRNSFTLTTALVDLKDGQKK